MREHYALFGDKLPRELHDEFDALVKRMGGE